MNFIVRWYYFPEKDGEPFLDLILSLPPQFLSMEYAKKMMDLFEKRGLIRHENSECIFFCLPLNDTESIDYVFYKEIEK